MLTREDIEILLRFLNRVNLTGAEALIFLTITTKLSNLLNNSSGINGDTENPKE